MLGAGSTLGRYAILDKLGEGGMGTVFLARDPELDRRVALKVLNDAQKQVDVVRARFVREARLMAKLDHPNIVKVFDAGTAPEGAFIVMELVEGTSLESWLEEKLQATSDILDKFLMAGYALAAAHSAGIVHRDFKPANVLIDRKGRIAVTDFGIAGVGETPTTGADSATLPGNPAMTQAGAIMGTPAYMSPEQFRGEKTDARTDQFSFAVALYEALFRETPFAAESIEELKAAVILGTLRPISNEGRSRAPSGIYDALRRALSKNPADRFPTMLVMLRELERCISESPKKRGVGRKVALLGVGAVVIGLGVVGVRSIGANAAEPVPPAPTPARVPSATASASAPTPTEGALVGIAGKCLDASRSELELRTCNGGSSQHWRITNDKLTTDDGRCVGTAPGHKGVRVFLQTQPCSNDMTQMWHLRRGHLVNAVDKCANVERSKTEDGTPIVVWDCRDSANSLWHLAPR